MSWMDGLTYDSSRYMRDESERKATRRRELLRDLDHHVSRAEQGDVPAMTRVLELLAELHGIRIDWREPQPGRSRGFAYGNSQVVIPPVRSVVEFAIGLHEIGHCLSERCAGGDHAATITDTAHKCIRCEVLAWEKAMELAPFSQRMHRELAACLDTYRRSTRAPSTAIEALKQISGTVTWASEQQKRRTFGETGNALSHGGRNS